MKIYILSLSAGLLVGVIYGLLNVRSPAPPVVALVGLLGILLGEQIVPLAKSLWSREPAAVSWLHQIRPHVFGHMPGGGVQPVPKSGVPPVTVQAETHTPPPSQGKS